MELLHPPRRHVLLTGRPGIGKTTVLMKVAQDLPSGYCLGFVTEAIYNHGRRIGFDVVTLDGRRAPLATKDGRGRARVGPYAVVLGGFESLILPLLGQMRQHARPVLIDEVGKMECLSTPFRDDVWKLLDEGPSVIATVPSGGTPFIRSIRERPDVRLLDVTIEERDDMPRLLREAILG